jgi:hypothetical protein
VARPGFHRYLKLDLPDAQQAARFLRPFQVGEQQIGPTGCPIQLHPKVLARVLPAVAEYYRDLPAIFGAARITGDAALE